MQQARNNSISIITVTYSSSTRIVNLLQSIENSSDIKFVKEIIIIENNSPDKLKTQTNINRYKRKSKLVIKFIKSNENYGFGKSCNYGASITTSKYILFINPDTEVKKHSISTLLNHTILTNADISGGKSVTYEGKRHLTVVRKPNIIIGLFEFSNLGKFFHIRFGHSKYYYLDKTDVLDDKSDRVVDAIGGAYLLIKNKVFQQLNGFDEKFFMYLEDVDLSIRANKLNYKIVYCPHSIIKHIGGASSENKYKIRHSAWFDSRKYYFRKHHNIFINLII